MGAYFLPRPIHPFAWWGWAIGLSVAANVTSNPLLLLLLVASACLVTLSRRGDNPWAKGFVVYLWLGLFVVVMRVAFRVLFGGGDGATVLVRLPEVALPWWVGGIRLLGSVSLEAVLAGLYDGGRLATLIICLGAANSLANPKRLLASLPGALYEAGTILVVAIGVFPQLGDSLVRVRRARKLRASTTPKGRRGRLGVVETLIVPVISDALDRSLSLAASMDVRGYGRHGTASRAERGWNTAIGLTGTVVLGIGLFLHLSRLGGGAVWFLVGGTALLVWSIHRAGRTVRRTAYRPIRWRAAETLVLACGWAPLAAIEVTRRSPDIAVLAPRIAPFVWPTLTPLLGVAVLLAALPAFLTPAPALAGARRPTAQEGLS